MRALVKYERGFGNVELQDVEEPGCGDDQIKIEVSASAANCLRVLKPLGQYTQVGIFGHEVTLDFDQVFFKQLRVVGSVGYTAATSDRLLKVLPQKSVSLKDLISHKLPLDRWQEAFKLCESKEAIKVLLSPS